MPFEFDPRFIRRLLAVGLAIGATGLQAASGVAVSRGQEYAVKLGMTTAEVRQALGRPANVFNYRSAPGASWAYYVVESAYGRSEFHVDFDSDGRVIAAREYAFPGGA